MSFLRADRGETAVELNIIQKNGAVLLLAVPDDDRDDIAVIASAAVAVRFEMP